MMALGDDRPSTPTTSDRERSPLSKHNHSIEGILGLSQSDRSSSVSGLDEHAPSSSTLYIKILGKSFFLIYLFLSSSGRTQRKRRIRRPRGRLPAHTPFEQAKTRTHHLHKATVYGTRGGISEDEVSRYLHKRKAGREFGPDRGSSAG